MRKITTLTDGWLFLKEADSATDAAARAASDGVPVTLPHTWNAQDGQDGGNDYHRGTCWYIRPLSASEAEG